MNENVRLLDSNMSSSGYNSNALLKLEQYLKAKQCGGCCFNVRPLADAEIVNVREMSGYVLRLWTLIENRWTTEEMAPFHGDEECLNEPVGNVWRDYQFDPPVETMLPNQKARYANQHLVNSRRKDRCAKCDCQGHISCGECQGYGHLKCVLCKEKGQIECCQVPTCTKCSGKGSYVCRKCAGHGKYDCSECLSHGQVQCPQCKGHRFVVIWTRLHVKWYNVNSTLIHKPHAQCILPSSEIEKTSDKVTCLIHDNVWSSTIESIDSILDTCVGLPQDFRDKINAEFRSAHCEKVGQVLRVNCIIQRLKIKELEYKLNTIKDDVFIFCLYGEDETKVYDNQYPYRYCGLRCSCLLM